MAAKNEDDDNKKVYPTKKVLFVESHGVKTFPTVAGGNIFLISNKYLATAQIVTMIYLDWLSSNLSGNTNLA
jgi:hypothetical protein